jgi:hypothetical protein
LTSKLDYDIIGTSRKGEKIMRLYIVTDGEGILCQSFPTQEAAEKFIVNCAKEDGWLVWNEYTQYISGEIRNTFEGAEIPRFSDWLWRKWGYDPDNAIEPGEWELVCEDEDWRIMCVNVPDGETYPHEIINHDSDLPRDMASYKMGYNDALDHIKYVCSEAQRG